MSCTPKNLSKRPFTLLEVMVAFTLVLLCVVPLLRTHLMMFHEERRLVRELAAEQLAGVIFSEVLPLLYENKIPWEENQVLSYIEPSILEPLEAHAKKLGYHPAVSVETVKSKPKDSEEGCFIKTVEVELKPASKRVVRYRRNVVIERKVMEVAP